MYPQLFAWPDQLDRNGLIHSTELQKDQKAAVLFRLGEINHAESLLLAHLAEVVQFQSPSPLVLLAWMRLENRNLYGFRAVFRTLQRKWPDHPEVRVLMLKNLLVTIEASLLLVPRLSGCLPASQLHQLFQLLYRM